MTIKNAYLTAVSSGSRGADDTVCTDMSVWVKEKVSSPDETSSKLDVKWKQRRGTYVSVVITESMDKRGNRWDTQLMAD